MSPDREGAPVSFGDESRVQAARGGHGGSHVRSTPKVLGESSGFHAVLLDEAQVEKENFHQFKRLATSQGEGKWQIFANGF